VIGLARDRAALLDERLRRATADMPTYPEIGRTQEEQLPAGYTHDRISLRVGEGASAWERARTAIRTWQAHLHARITITPPDAGLIEGMTVLASRGFGPVTIVAPCRVVYVIDLPARFGFAYGTLPGHPEQGEEAFHVVLHDDGTVSAEIVAFSRPADLATRAASPVARLIQKAVTRRYLEGIKLYVAPAK